MSDERVPGTWLAARLAELDYRWLLPGTLLLALMPWPIEPEPHLIQKTHMLLAGTLKRPIDVVDLFWHGWAVVLVLVKVGFDGVRALRRRQA